MTLTEQDRIDIADLVNRHGHLVDAGELDRLAELFTPDVVYDVTDFGLGSLHGPAAVRDAALALGPANPVGHHVTNIVITPVDEVTAAVQSKGIGIMAGGTVGSAVYDDVVTHGPNGWKISRRKVTARRTPLGGPGPREAPGPRAVLEQFRQAVVDQSADALSRLYATDAVHEFPFTRPGLPSRLDGRDEIMRWSTSMWHNNSVRYERYRTRAVHDTADPDTIIVEQEAVGADFALPNIVVLTVRDGQIAHLRDYVNILAAEAVIG
ncbi:nuclear transport factor 2 family protein [Kutzneria sp. CA-103260]|uniref:nuclear transport factor 2 family protein n=1 Tax=Kutzneria sp. CA-103260 TaxID=2802641 RepID=UPI001BEF8A4F|nr:nuclear transport factor 2 family protein [Kutzneria sp. CA-103260]QUQ62618.1 SnoaL-like domain protein [Kutzneria sp. CA-103260]